MSAMQKRGRNADMCEFVQGWYQNFHAIRTHMLYSCSPGKAQGIFMHIRGINQAPDAYAEGLKNEMHTHTH
jgi:hypothetical protein